MNKKIKPNRYKSEIKGDEGFSPASGAGIDFCLKCTMTAAFISILSLASIFAYDMVTQSNFFTVKTIDIKGTKQLLRDDIIKTAGLDRAVNIFKLNLCFMVFHIREYLKTTVMVYSYIHGF